MRYKRSLMSIAMASIMLVSLCAVVSATSVSATVSSSANAQNALASAPAGVVGAPAVISRDTTSFDLFVRGLDNALWWRHIPSGGTWGAWNSLGGGLSSSPAVAAYGTNYLQVNARGNDGALWSRWSNNGGSSWTSWYKPIAGKLLEGTGPASCVAGNEQYLFVTGMSGAMYWSHWTLGNGAQPFTKFGGKLTSSPSATATGRDGVYVVGRGANGALWSTSTLDYGATWTPWVNKGGQILTGTSPAACFYLTGGPNPYVGLFWTGTDHQLYFKKFPNSPGVSLGGYLTSGPAAASPIDNTLDVFVRGGDGALYFDWTNNGGISWSNWLKAPA